MKYTSWGNREKIDGTNFVHLFEEEHTDIATFPSDVDGETTAQVAGSTWKLTATQQLLTAEVPASATASVPESSTSETSASESHTGQTFTASIDGKKFSRAKEITIDFGDKKVFAINESGGDWVYVDAADNKLGQFSGGNNGVRKSITEFEPDVALSLDEQVFLSWVTRTALEAKLMVTSMIVIMSLLLMLPVVILSLM